MAPATRLCLLPRRPLASAGAVSLCRGTRVAAAAARAIHSNPAQPAKVVPVYGTGPPPEPPQPTAEFAAEIRDERLARRKRQAEMLRRAGDLKALRQEQEDGTTKPGGLKRRFWKTVDVREVNDALEVHLDTRPLRHPSTKTIIRLPPSKPHLAHAIALEWDSLVSAQQATKQHLIPLTSLTCRALDIASEDAAANNNTTIRTYISQTLLRYLDTDSLLCLAPPPPASEHDPAVDGPTLHETQRRAYADTAAYLARHVWPGVALVPALDGADANSILPRRQPPGTREVVQAWIRALSPFELAGLERATLAGKSLLAAARLVAEWSEERAHPRSRGPAGGGEGGKFGVEEAARAVSLEVEWQTRKWGEVEDTHDVEKEDLRRQLGSAVLLVSGDGTGKGTGAVKSS